MRDGKMIVTNALWSVLILWSITSGSCRHLGRFGSDGTSIDGHPAPEHSVFASRVGDEVESFAGNEEQDKRRKSKGGAISRQKMEKMLGKAVMKIVMEQQETEDVLRLLEDVGIGAEEAELLRAQERARRRDEEASRNTRGGRPDRKSVRIPEEDGSNRMEKDLERAMKERDLEKEQAYEKEREGDLDYGKFNEEALLDYENAPAKTELLEAFWSGDYSMGGDPEEPRSTQASLTTRNPEAEAEAFGNMMEANVIFKISPDDSEFDSSSEETSKTTLDETNPTATDGPATSEHFPATATTSGHLFPWTVIHSVRPFPPRGHLGQNHHPKTGTKDLKSHYRYDTNDSESSDQPEVAIEVSTLATVPENRSSSGSSSGTSSGSSGTSSGSPGISSGSSSGTSSGSSGASSGSSGASSGPSGASSGSSGASSGSSGTSSGSSGASSGSSGTSSGTSSGSFDGSSGSGETSTSRTTNLVASETNQSENTDIRTTTPRQSYAGLEWVGDDVYRVIPAVLDSLEYYNPENDCKNYGCESDVPEMPKVIGSSSESRKDESYQEDVPDPTLQLFGPVMNITLENLANLTSYRSRAMADRRREQAQKAVQDAMDRILILTGRSNATNSSYPISKPERLTMFHPTCELPRNTDPEAWADPYSMNMQFSLNLSSSQHIKAAKLRLFKLPQERPASNASSPDDVDDEEKKIEISVFYYMKSLRKNRTKKRLMDSIVSPLTSTGGAVALDVRQGSRLWRVSHRNGNNHGLVVQVKDQDGRQLQPSQYIQSYTCHGSQEIMVQQDQEDDNKINESLHSSSEPVLVTFVS